jgi:hypothetical protein
MLRTVGSAKRVEAEVKGLGLVRLDHIMGQRFAYLNGHITSLKQLRDDAAAVDADRPTSQQLAHGFLAGVKS